MFSPLNLATSFEESVNHFAVGQRTSIVFGFCSEEHLHMSMLMRRRSRVAVPKWGIMRGHPKEHFDAPAISIDLK